MSGSSRPIVIVTGANNGIGFGFCRRLLYQLSQLHPTDAVPIFPRSNDQDSGIKYPCDGLTLIMACRNKQRADAAREELFKLFDKDVAKRELQPAEVAHLETFRKNLIVKIHSLDLASVHSVLEFSDEITRTYPYVSHIFCNAGVATFKALAWIRLLKQLCTDFVGAVTNPNYYIEEVGVVSEDGLGWVWQCNLFGHYVLSRALESHLAASASVTGGPARVIWTSSLESLPASYDPVDWQYIKSSQPYEGTKYEIDILRAELDRRALCDPSPSIRHFTVHPGVVWTAIDAALIGYVLHRVKAAVFYVARFFGSPHHTINSWHGATSAVHLVLVSLAFIPSFVSLAARRVVHSEDTDAASGAEDQVPVRIHSVTDRWGRDGVRLDPVAGWKEHIEESGKLADRCEQLYQTFLAAEGRAKKSAANGNGVAH